MEGGSGQQRVLITSGDPLAQEIHAQFLRMASYDVVLAETGERALLTLRELPRRVDWLFTTMTLPGLVDGWMLAHEFHRRHPTRAVLFASDADTASLVTKNAMLFLPNPVSPVELVAQLHGLSGRAERPVATVPTPPLVSSPVSIPPAPPIVHRRIVLRRATA